MVDHGPNMRRSRRQAKAETRSVQELHLADFIGLSCPCSLAGGPGRSSRQPAACQPRENGVGVCTRYGTLVRLLVLAVLGLYRLAAQPRPPAVIARP